MDYYEGFLTESQAWIIYDNSSTPGCWRTSTVWFSRGGINGRLELWFRVTNEKDDLPSPTDKCVRYRKWVKEEPDPSL